MTFFLKQDIQHAFNQAAGDYDAVAVLPQEICNRMIERLDVMRILPITILDLGAGTGYGTQLLQKRYPDATVIALDLAEKMLNNQTYRDHPYKLCADAEQLPLANNSIDLIFSNLMLPWCNDIEVVFQEVKRVLKPNGLFLFSTFGPETLKELRFSWARVDNGSHVHLFFDLHDIGDALLRAHFSDPVMDMEMLTLTYKTAKQSLDDLRISGMYNILKDRKKTLTGKHLFQRFMENYKTWRQQDGMLPNTYEIAYGHAWKINATEKLRSNEIAIPVSALKR